MKPVPDKRLGSIEAEYDSAAGLIKSSWKFEGDIWNWSVTIPEGAVATITLPGEDDSADYEGGTYNFSKKL
jgi:alpha-L-rhamnosidase